MPVRVRYALLLALLLAFGGAAQAQQPDGAETVRVTADGYGSVQRDIAVDGPLDFVLRERATVRRQRPRNEGIYTGMRRLLRAEVQWTLDE